MAHGIELFNSAGQMFLSIGDRMTKLFATVDYVSSTANVYEDISILGISPNGQYLALVLGVRAIGDIDLKFEIFNDFIRVHNKNTQYDVKLRVLQF